MPLCRNCQEEVQGNFCSNCGQPTQVRRLSFKNIMHDIQGKMFGLDSKLVRTTRDLILRPGKVYRTFLSGNRIQYTSGSAYFFIMLTITAVLISLMDINYREFMEATAKSTMGGGEFEKNAVSDKIMEFISSNLRIFSFSLIPIYAITTKLFFYKDRLNFIEYMSYNFYLNGLISALTILDILLYQFFGIILWFSMFKNILTLFLFGFLAMKCFQGRAAWWRFIKGILVYVVSMLLIVVAGMVFFIILALVDMELFKSILEIKET